MNDSKNILIVDDHRINREMLKNILCTEYLIIEADNGEIALEILQAQAEQVLAVVYDVQMPQMNGFEFLHETRLDDRLSHIPIIMLTANHEVKNEVKALQLGAWDYIESPYNGEVLLHRLKNAIRRSKLTAKAPTAHGIEQNQWVGIDNKADFFRHTEVMLHQYDDKRFAFIYFFLERFQLINTFYGVSEGDQLYKYLDRALAKISQPYDLFTYGCMDSDVFCFCMEYDREEINQIIENTDQILLKFNAEYDLEPNFGVYVIKDNHMPLETMYSNANMAAKSGIGNYMRHCTYYTDEMDRAFKQEQEILNEMYSALENGEFQVYLQPKYNIHSNAIVGAESLVRWAHPEKGIISPGQFIPIFEKNGFITKLDYYVWEKTCKILRNWLDKGIAAKPISVNVSQVNVYNPRLTEQIIQLVDQYNLPHELFELEITESTYAFNSAMLIKIVEELRNNNFTILMDDFGNGYSSLNILKDIDIDVLKLDMLFMVNKKDSGRGENIIASIIRMAKWLKIPVVVEGVETSRQIAFLKSVGCDYVQGFYFAKPMPVKDYEALFNTADTFEAVITKTDHDDFDMDALFQSSPQMRTLFGDILQALVIFEFDGQNMELIRANEGYFDLFGSDDVAMRMSGPIHVVDVHYRQAVQNAFVKVTASRKTAECEFTRRGNDGDTIWVNMKLRYMQSIGEKHMIMGLLDDITAQKVIDFELSKYRKAVITEGKDEKIMLIVDDVAANRGILKKIFEQEYEILEASNGQEALEQLDEEPKVSMILLDIVMPLMNGWQFLQHKKNSIELSEIPVIIISGKNNLDEQETALEMGVDDYIVKPFVPEAVRKRVKNALDSNTLFRQVIRRYHSTTNGRKPDMVTGLYEKELAITLIHEHLEDFADDMNVMILLEIQNFLAVSKMYVETYDESLLERIGVILGDLFRRKDIAFHDDEDVFCIYAKDFQDIEKLRSRLDRLGELLIADNQPDGFEVTFNIGVAYAPIHGRTYEELIGIGEKALQVAKSDGTNQMLIFGENGQT